MAARKARLNNKDQSQSNKTSAKYPGTGHSGGLQSIKLQRASIYGGLQKSHLDVALGSLDFYARSSA